MYNVQNKQYYVLQLFNSLLAELLVIDSAIPSQVANELLEHPDHVSVSVALPTSAVDDENRGIKIGLGLVAAVVMSTIVLVILVILGIFTRHVYKRRYLCTILRNTTYTWFQLIQRGVLNSQ